MCETIWAAAVAVYGFGAVESSEELGVAVACMLLWGRFSMCDPACVAIISGVCEVSPSFLDVDLIFAVKVVVEPPCDDDAWAVAALSCLTA